MGLYRVLSSCLSYSFLIFSPFPFLLPSFSTPLTLSFPYFILFSARIDTILAYNSILIHPLHHLLLSPISSLYLFYLYYYYIGLYRSSQRRYRIPLGISLLHTLTLLSPLSLHNLSSPSHYYPLLYPYPFYFFILYTLLYLFYTIIISIYTLFYTIIHYIHYYYSIYYSTILLILFILLYLLYFIYPCIYIHTNNTHTHT